MTRQDVVVIGASAGGVEAISTLVADLPRDLPAAVFVVLHLSRGRSVLPEILTRAGRLPARHPADGDLVQNGRIFVAPPDHHMTLEGNHIRVVHGPTENGVRPAVDPLFRSAARVYGPRVLGVVLTGSLDDGTAGMAAVKEAGGVSIIQDPDDAFAPSMPRSVLESVAVDHVCKLSKLGGLITRLAGAPAAHAPEAQGPAVRPTEVDLGPVPIALGPADRPGSPSVFSCPECHGTLWEVDDGRILRFRCRVGHAYSPDSMLAAQTDSVDRALWAALRSLEERVALTRRLSDRARRRNHQGATRAFDDRALAAEEHAGIVRTLLVNRAAGHVVPDHTDEAPAEEMVGDLGQAQGPKG